MNDQQNRPQTLLEAAKRLVEEHTSYIATPWANLRAAIAREEAKQASLQDDAGRYAYWKSKATRYESERDTCYSDYQKEAARAQQAESTAAWHKAESERLSAELAKTKEFRSYAEEAANFGGKWRERAEDAEAKVRNLQRQNREAIDERDLLRLRTATIDNLRQRAEKAEAELAMMGKQLARLVELQVNPPIMVAHPFEGDPQTCAFGSNAFGGNREVSETDDDYEDPVDPTTGFTFATYRRLLEALGGKS
ncbi:MAG: hypothetical protein IPK64_19740 [bacterium]|nr:hypothetical protein [bacterium]